MSKEFCVLFGLFCIGIGIWAFIETRRCKKEIKGIFIITTRYTAKGVEYHAPVFRFEFGGKYFHVLSLKSFSKKYIKKNFEFGKEYSIFIDEKRPRFFVEKKSNGVKYLVWVFIGVLFLLTAVAKTN